ncbi:hypothetical protein D9M72_482270 [compost metagenome]
MDKCRNRSRAFHGIRKPGVQQELRRLAHRAHEEQKAGRSDRVSLVKVHAEQGDNRLPCCSAFGRQVGLGGGEDRLEVDRAEQHEDEEDAEREAEVADAVDDEGLHRGSIRRRLLIPEADEQVGRETHTFPAEEHLHQVVRRDEHEHREGEERQIGKEARTMRIVVHVSDRIDMHERRHRVDDDEHDRFQRIDAERPFDIEAAGLDPAQHRNLDHLLVAQGDVEEDVPGQRSGDDHQTACHIFRCLGADRSTEEAGDQKADQRQEDDSLDDGIHSPISPSSC